MQYENPQIAYQAGWRAGFNAGQRSTDLWRSGYRTGLRNPNSGDPDYAAGRPALCPDCLAVNPDWPNRSARRNAACPAHSQQRKRWRQNEWHAGRTGTKRHPYQPTPLPPPATTADRDASVLLALAADRDDPLAVAVRAHLAHCYSPPSEQPAAVPDLP